jgi:hypothetical protein
MSPFLALNGHAGSHHLCPLLKVDRPCHRAAVTIDLAKRLQIPGTDVAGIRSVLWKKDGFEPIAAELTDRRDWSDRQGAQTIGQFLVDQDGIVRWVNIECAKDGLAGLQKFPTDDDFLAAARDVVG